MTTECQFKIGSKYKTRDGKRTAFYMGVNPCKGDWCNHVFCFTDGNIQERGANGERFNSEATYGDILPGEVREPLKWEGTVTANRNHSNNMGYVNIPPEFIYKKVRVTIEEIIE